MLIAGFDSTPFTETGDLINFYNHIYVQVMKDVIAGFAATSKPVSYAYLCLSIKKLIVYCVFRIQILY